MSKTSDHSGDGDAIVTAARAVGSIAVGADERRMVKAEIFGRHSHRARDGTRVHVWRRGGKLMARGRYLGRAFGLTLGADEAEAEAALRQLLVDIEGGAFVRPSEVRDRPFKHGPPPRLPVRQMCGAFVDEKRKLRGKGTAQDYAARLAPALEFAEAPANRRRWTWSQDLQDRAFAVELRAFLHSRATTRNGHSLAAPGYLSAGQIFNILSCVATVLNWAKGPGVNLLPIGFVSPFTREIVGQRPRRDPLAPSPVPMDLRIEIVRVMDEWQLCALGPSFILPDRSEDFAGLLISDLSLERREMTFCTRVGGADFNKGRMAFRTVWPAELDPIIRRLISGRTDGPLILRRSVIERRRRPRSRADTTDQIIGVFQRELSRAKPNEIQADNDRKALFRGVLLDLGGVSEDNLRKEFLALLERVRPGHKAKYSDRRGAITTDMKDAGVDVIFRRFVTAHALGREVLSHYETQDLHLHMNKYFNHVRPLLEEIARRAVHLGIN